MQTAGVNASNYEQLAPFPDGSEPDQAYLVNVVIETPRATRHKYAFDAKTGLFKLKSTIAEGLQWPYDYGFVPGTLAADGDPIDALFLNDEPTFPGCFTEARLLGVIRIQKNGTQNDRLVTCAKRIEGISLSTDPYERIDDLPKPVIDSLCRFLVEYSEEAGNKVECTGVDGRKKALQSIFDGTQAFARRKSTQGLLA
jgi:inorganic pyrophosphatase